MTRINFILQLLFPGGILFVACGALLYTDTWVNLSPSHIDLFGGIVLLFGFFLSWRFDRNRLFYALLLLLIADLAERSFFPLKTTVSIQHLIALLVPLNFLLIGIMKEKGIRTLFGLFNLSLLPLQALLIFCWFFYWDGRYYELLELSHFPGRLSFIPDIYVGVVLLTLFVQSMRYTRYRNPVETAFLWAILCTAVAGVMTPGTETTLFRITSALILIISVFEMSYALAYRDELTGLQSRRALNETFNKLGGQYVVAMADIDHFKKLNDTYGHDVGDEVLRMVAARLLKCPGGGQVFRYGGEEFCILFRGKMIESAIAPLEKLCRAIADDPFVVRQALRPISKPQKPRKDSRTRKSIKVTISIGLAGKSLELKDPNDVMKAADQALYRAKKAGRNRVCK